MAGKPHLIARAALWIVCLASVVSWVAPAGADCAQVGNAVTCSATDADGFGAGTEDGLTITVGSGATVQNTIDVDENSLVVVEAGAAISTSGASEEGIIVGAGSAVTNAGSIATPGAGSTGVLLDGANATFENTGALSVTQNATSAIDTDASAGHRITNRGTVTVGGSLLVAINADGVGDVITNESDGVITMNGGGGAVIQTTAADAVITNAGTLTVNNALVAALNAQGDGSSIANSGSVVLNGAISGGISIDADDGTVVNSGSISSSQAIVTGILSDDDGIAVTHSGSILLTGTSGNAISLGSNSTVVSSGVLQAPDHAILLAGGTNSVTLQNGSLISGEIDGGSGTDTLEITLGTDGSFSLSDDIVDFEAMNLNSGTFTLDGTATVTNTQLLGGTLTGSGTLAGSLTIGPSATLDGGIGVTGGVSVDAGGTASGTGSITGTLISNSGGRVAPGNSIGTLMVTDFVANPGSVLEVEVNALGQSDLVQASNTATLNGGLVQPIVLDDIGGASTTYTILTAAGGVTGSFDGLDTSRLGAVFTASLGQDASNVFLTLERSSYASLAGTPLQRAVAATLDDLRSSASGDTATLLEALDGVSNEAAYRDALDQLHAESYSWTSRLARAQARAGLLAVAGRIEERRARERGLAAWPTPGAVSSPSLSWHGFEAWGRAFGLALDSDTARSRLGLERAGLRAPTAGLTLGLDRHLGEHLLAGLSLSAHHTDALLEKQSGDARDLAGQLGLYTGYTRGPFSVDAQIHYGLHFYETERSVEIGSFDREARSDHRAHQVSLAYETAYAARFGPIDVGPTLGLQYFFLDEEGFDENGAGAANLSVDERRTHSLRALVGARIGGAIRTPLGRLRPTLAMRRTHEFIDDRPRIAAALVDAGGAEFTSRADAPVRQTWNTQLGLTLERGERLGLALRYEADWADNELAQSASLAFRWRW